MAQHASMVCTAPALTAMRPDVASACATHPDSHMKEELQKQCPETTILGYPLQIANEEDTLGLIDEVLNAWGR